MHDNLSHFKCGQEVHSLCYRVPKCDVIKFSFLHFNIFITILQYNTMENPYTPNLTWIGLWRPEIQPHEYLISPIMQWYLGPPWSNSNQIWAVHVFHHVPLMHGIQNVEVQIKFSVMSSLWYSVGRVENVPCFSLQAARFKGQKSCIDTGYDLKSILKVEYIVYPIYGG